MKAALTREGTHPAAGSTFGKVHGADPNFVEAPDPSSVDEIGRPGVTGGRTPGEGTLSR
jgi:hypothetical protein